MIDQEVVDNETAKRFELRVDGALAKLDYRSEGDRLILVHTEVPKELGGRGLGEQLVNAAIDRAVELGLTIVPQCSYVRHWLEGHPETAETVTIEW